MTSFRDSGLWGRTLGCEGSAHQQVINKLRESFISFREKVAVVAAEISRDLPDYTVHDITHMDALWDVADCIIGESYPLNPVEAYVLGGAFLLHDLGMTVAAYPNGMNDIEALPIWRDSVVQVCQQLSLDVAGHSYREIPENIRDRVVSTVLRKLHAATAEKLVTNIWARGDKRFCLIEDHELRNSLGSVIGKIAHSHWWDVSKIEDEFRRPLGAMHWGPGAWTIDPLKIAAILRVSDAAHIDARRAPAFVRAIRRPKGGSDVHWSFQEKLQKPYLSEDSLFYSSGMDFSCDETHAWWMCYDTLNMIDKELRQTDALLADRRMERFRARRVYAVDSPERLSQFIRTDGWQPINAFVHVGDLPKIIKSLGGRELYGDDLKVPIRELMQNASDAIRARRSLEGRSEDWGNITVTLVKDGSKSYLEVADDGIGMSLDVVKNFLFEFGTSYWGSDLMLEEHPGLISKKFSSTGRFGIGFFSVFMLGSDVKVVTRKCTQAASSTFVVEFLEGLDQRPIIRDAKDEEILIDGGTRVRVRIDESIISKRLLKTDAGDADVDFRELILSIAPALDCNVRTHFEGESSLIPANYWLSCSGEEFISALKGISRVNGTGLVPDSDFCKKAASSVDFLKNSQGEIIGRGFLASSSNLYDDNELDGVITVGGFVEATLSGISGIFPGRTTGAARQEAIPLASRGEFLEWAVGRIGDAKSLYTEGQLIWVAQVLRVLGGAPQDLPIAYTEKGALDLQALKDFLKKVETVVVLDMYVLKYRLSLIDNVEVEPNVIFTSYNGWRALFTGVSREWGLNNDDDWISWITCMGYIQEAISDVWGVDIEKVKAALRFDVERPKVVVGKISGSEIKESGFKLSRADFN